MVRLQFNGLLISLNGFGIVALGMINIPYIEIGRSIIRVKFNGLLITLNGFIKVALFPINDSQVMIG